MTDQSTRRRVKLYALNAERQWDDRGTGHVTSTYVEKLQGVSLLVKAESDGNILLESKIQPETIYQKQQETLIVWSEGDNFDLALSFQERAGCDEIWERICQVQGRDPSVEITQEVVEESEDERFDDMSDTVPSIELPAAEMGRLEEISELINSCLHSAIKREKLTLAVEADNYIPKLMRMFQMCEDLENTAGLHHLHDIIINLFQLNKNALIEAMFKIDVIFDVVGCLEYDPANPKPTRHREYLKQMANFKQVLPIRNSELLAKIHQTYRVQYIQDIVLPTPTMFEDNVLSTLSSFIFFNKLDIVRQLQDDEKFLTEFFSLLSEEKTPITKRRDLVLFLKEFCTFSHTLQPQSKETFFKTLLSLGVLQALETTLTVDAGETSQHGHVIKAACVDVLMYIVETVPSMVREHMLQQAEACDDDQLLMNLIVEQMVCDRDPEVGLAVPLSGIIRILIDPDNMMAALNRSEKTEFFAFFYKHCMHSLVAPLLSNTTDESPLHDDPATVQLLNLVLELLSFCVEHHTFHAKNFIITRNMVARILVLMKSKHKYLVLDALRFLRKMVALKDENYNRHIVKQNLFAPVVEAFFHNQGRYNLLDSAVIELFEFIKTEDIKTLLSYIVETFGDKLLDVTYVPTFRSLKQRYEQQQDRLQQRTTALESVPSILRGTSRYRRDPRQMDEDEEMWFNDDDEFEETVEPPPTGLAAAAVSDLEHIGKMIEGRGKLFTSSPVASAELTADKESLDVAGVTAAPLVAAPGKLPLTPAQNAAVSMVKKVGLVDYDADSDEEEEEGCEDEHLSPLALQLPAAAAALQLSNSPSQLSGSPSQLSGSPNQISGSPNQLSGSPNQLSGSPNQLSGSSIQLNCSPNQLTGSPSHLSNSPNQLSNSQNQLSNSPSQLSSSPNQLSNSPNQLSNSPNQLPGSPSQFSGSVGAGTSPVSIVNPSGISAGALGQGPLYSPSAQQLASSAGQLAASQPSASPQLAVTSSQQTPTQQEKPTQGAAADAAPADSTLASSGQKNGSVAAESPADVELVPEQESPSRLAAQLKAANQRPAESDSAAITANGEREPEPALNSSVGSPNPPRPADSTNESGDAVNAKAPASVSDSSKSSVTSNDEACPVGVSAEGTPEADNTATDSVSSSEQSAKEPPSTEPAQPESEKPATDATAEAADSASESTAGDAPGAGGRPRRDDDDDQLPCAKRARLDGT